jgi:hypothetical protein
LLLAGWLAYSPALNMKATRSSETLVKYDTTPRHISEDSILQSHNSQYFKSSTRLFVYSRNLTTLFQLFIYFLFLFIYLFI